MIRIIKLIIGVISLIFGIMGIFLPLLPTTPFLLLSSYLFGSSSPYLQNKLLNNKYVGSYIKNYQIEKAIPLKIKIIALLTLWIAILSSVIFFTQLLWLRLLLISIATAVSIHILSLKTLR